MKLIKWLIVPISIISFFSCQKDKDDSNVVSQQFIHKYGFDMNEKEWQSREKEGKSITVLDNGVTVTNTYNNGALHGPTTYTFPHSSIIEKIYIYDNSVRIKEIAHDKQGVPYKEEAYELNNTKTITLWDRFGVPISVEKYVNGILREGDYFKPDNQLEASVQNGNGIRVKRDRNGELLRKEIIESGDVKNRTTFHPNGKIQSQISFKNYNLNGAQVTYSQKGEIVMKAYWNEGQLHGTKTTYRNGKKVSDVPYVYGKKSGVERTWDREGDLTEEIHWEKDKKHGSHRVYSENDTEIKWFYKGKAVSIKRYEEFSTREKLVANKDLFLEMVNTMDEQKALLED